MYIYRVFYRLDSIEFIAYMVLEVNIYFYHHTYSKILFNLYNTQNLSCEGRGRLKLDLMDEGKISDESGKVWEKPGQSISGLDTNLGNGDEPDRVPPAGKTF